MRGTTRRAFAGSVIFARSGELTVEELCAGAEHVLRENQSETGEIGDWLSTIYAAKALSARGIDLATVIKEGGVSLLDALLYQAKAFIATPVPTLISKWDSDKRSLETTWGSRLMWVLTPQTIGDLGLLGNLVSHSLAVFKELSGIERVRTNFTIYTLLGLREQAPVYADWIRLLEGRLNQLGNAQNGWPEKIGGNSEVDHTAAALMALSLTRSEFFTRSRNPDGGFGTVYQGESNIDSTSWAAMTGTAPPSLHYYRTKLQRYGALSHDWYGGKPYCHHCVHEPAQIWSTANALLALTLSGSTAYS